MSTLKRFNCKIGNYTKNVVVINYKPGIELVEKTNDIHHIHILDRSLSMTYEINELINNVQETIKHINDNDLLSIIWFSSENQFRTVIKGAKKFDKLDDILNKLRSTVGTTCFSDPLKEVSEIVDEFESIMPISITIFTDGQPVVSHGEAEEKRRIFIELEKFKDKVIAINTIGYGNYYNEEMLKDISGFSQFGVFKHSTQINEYIDIFKNNHETIKNVIPSPVFIEGNEIFYLNRKFTTSKYHYMKLSSIDSNKNQFFVIVDNEFSLQEKIYRFNELEIESNQKTIANFYYTYAYNKYYEVKRKDSLDSIFQIRDKYLIDNHFKAFTFDECSLHQNELKKALFEPSNRFKDGVCDDNYISKNYIATDKDICVMDIIKILSNMNALWVPFHKDLDKYNRITKQAKSEFDLFTKDDIEVVSPMEDLVYNKSKSNVSLRVVIPGSIKLNPVQAKKVGLEPVYKTHKFRNFTLIKDGNLNIKKIMCLILESEYDLLKVLIKSFVESYYEKGKKCDFTNLTETLNDNKYYRVIIDLSKFPIINREYANDSTNIDKIFDKTLEITELEAMQKLLNYHIKGLEQYTHLQKIGEFKDKTKDQLDLLKEHGIRSDGSYSAPGSERDKNELCDSYYTREIEFYISGCTSFPKVEELLERLKNGKKLTTSMEILNQQNIILSKMIKDDGFDESMKTVKYRDYLIGKLKEVKYRLNMFRNDLSILKMAKLLTGDWFEGLKVDDKNNQYYEKNNFKMICLSKRVLEYI